MAIQLTGRKRKILLGHKARTGEKAEYTGSAQALFTDKQRGHRVKELFLNGHYLFIPGHHRHNKRGTISWPILIFPHYVATYRHYPFL